MMNTLIRITLCLVLLTLPMGCSWRPPVGPPWKQALLLEGPPGPPLFKEGWRAGCETGMAATANHLQKFFYRFKQDWELAQKPEYYAGWKVGWTYCQRYLFQYLKRDLV